MDIATIAKNDHISKMILARARTGLYPNDMDNFGVRFQQFCRAYVSVVSGSDISASIGNPPNRKAGLFRFYEGRWAADRTKICSLHPGISPTLAFDDMLVSESLSVECGMVLAAVQLASLPADLPADAEGRSNWTDVKNFATWFQLTQCLLRDEAQDVRYDLGLRVIINLGLIVTNDRIMR